MDCKKAMELITLFINEQLSAEDTEAFLAHIDSCSECREELEVTYSLMTAMKQLDEDIDLSDNYIEELNQKIETCYIDDLKRKRSCARRRAVLSVVIVLLVFMNGTTFRTKRQEEDQKFYRMIAGLEEMEQDSNLIVAEITPEISYNMFVLDENQVSDSMTENEQGTETLGNESSVTEDLLQGTPTPEPMTK